MGQNRLILGLKETIDYIPPNNEYSIGKQHFTVFPE